MPGSLAADRPTANETLRHLFQFRRSLCLDNPCTVLRSRCVYFAADASTVLGVDDPAVAVATLEAEYAVETRAYPSIVTPEAFADLARDAVWLPSDSYICHGSTSQGSGRSVFMGQHQLKGVGRTLHVGHHDFFRDLTGALSLREAIAEAAMEKRLRDVLTTPPLPIDFVLVPEQGDQPLRLSDDDSAPLDLRCVLGRRGSPLRIGHLEFLATALRTVNESTVGSYLAHLLLSHVGGVPDHGIAEKLLDTFDLLMQRAVRLSAESLVYAMRFSYWPDNFDLFSRVVDVAETRFHFPALLHDDEAMLQPDASDTPRQFFRRLALSSDRMRAHTLYPIRNVLSAIHLLVREFGMSADEVDERYTWDWLRDAHQQHVVCAIAKVLGIAEQSVRDSATLRAALTPLAAHFPLLPDPDTPPSLFNWDVFLAEFTSDAPLGAEARSLADVTRGAEFRRRISRDEHDYAMTVIGEYLGREIIAPYLAAGLDAVPKSWDAIPCLGRVVDTRPHTTSTPGRSATKVVRRARMVAPLRTVDGYIADVPYPSAFQHRFAPPWTDAMLLHHGVVPPRAERAPFTMVDLGCGDGYGLIVMAAAHPEGRFIGIDASVEHAARGTALIRELGIRNVELRAQTFAETRLRTRADYVTAQGVLSWVSPANRTACLHLATRLLKPGGVFTVGYNTQPGWASLAPFQRLVRAFAATVRGNSPTRFAAALELARATGAIDKGVLRTVDAWVRTSTPNYFAHEYLNEHWEALWSGDVMRTLAAHGLQFAGSAFASHMRDEFRFNADQRQRLAHITNVPTRELAADVLLNTKFRVDQFVKPPVSRLTQRVRTARRLSAHWMAMQSERAAIYHYRTPGGRIFFDSDAAHAILQLLERGPAPLRAVRGGEATALLHAADALFVADLIRPAAAFGDVTFAESLNARLIARPADTRDLNALVGAHGAAVPVTPEDVADTHALRRLGVSLRSPA